MTVRLIISVGLALCGGGAFAETHPTKVCVIESDLCQTLVSDFIAFNDGQRYDFVSTMPTEIMFSVRDRTCHLSLPEEFDFSATWGPSLEMNSRFFFIAEEDGAACLLSGYGQDALRHGGEPGAAIGSLEELRVE